METVQNDSYPRIEEKNPLKQGLKQDLENDQTVFGRIEEKNPLKQGLKLAYKALLLFAVTD